MTMEHRERFRQIRFALERAAYDLNRRADQLLESLDYNAEFFASDAQQIRQAIELMEMTFDATDFYKQFEPYLKDNETIFNRFLREIDDSNALMSILRNERIEHQKTREKLAEVQATLATIKGS